LKKRVYLKFPFWGKKGVGGGKYDRNTKTRRKEGPYHAKGKGGENQKRPRTKLSVIWQEDSETKPGNADAIYGNMESVDRRPKRKKASKRRRARRHMTRIEVEKSYEPRTRNAPRPGKSSQIKKDQRRGGRGET